MSRNTYDLIQSLELSSTKKNVLVLMLTNN